jgi:uncharacterized membrane protein YgcG
LYTAPATIPSPASVTVQAVSVADPTQSAQATVTIAQVTVTLLPAVASVTTLGTQAFTATVLYTSNTAVSWAVNGITGGNASVGTVSTSGVYTAPANVPSPATVTVTAVSAANPAVSAAASVTITSSASSSSSGGSSSGASSGGSSGGSSSSGGGGGHSGGGALDIWSLLTLGALLVVRRRRLRASA